MRRRAALVAWIALLAGLRGLPAGAMEGRLSQEEIQDLYSQAKEHFRKANEAAAGNPKEAQESYRKAALRFERLARDGGIRNGKLDYNIGNAYFRMGDLGRAILYYRTAERLIPGDPNLVQNLEYARSRRRDKIEERQQAKVLKTVFFWHEDLSPQTRSILFAASFALFWIGLSVRLVLRRAAPRWALAGLGILAALFGGSLAATQIAQARNAPGVILADELVARKGDGTGYEPAFKEPLHAGTEFALVEERIAWLHAELPDGRRCWVPREGVGLVR
jgi:tetratricopeptide (TPR) repeat protein